MADRPVPPKTGFRLRPSVHGIAALLLPLAVFLHPSARHAAPAFVVGIGLPALALLSFAFLAACIPPLARSAGRIADAATRLPDRAGIGESLEVRTRPALPGFLPGVRLRVEWSLGYGPFKRRIVAPLAGGEGLAAFRFDRRGLWEGSARLVAVDPFGFFVASVPLAGRNGTAVPPNRGGRHGRVPPGRPSADDRTAPRMREDAEERYERRGYVHGDDPRRIDWKQYARTGDLLVRTGEDSLPSRGRVWILAVGSPESVFAGRGYGRLDDGLAAASALVHRALEDDVDVRLKLPGSTWREASRFDWEAAMAAAEPAPISFGDLPPRGETLRIVAHPSDALGPAAAAAARDSGCRVSLVFPAAGARRAFAWKGFFLRGGESEGRAGLPGILGDALHRRDLASAISASREAGTDAYVL